jgi:hypothetical protein
MKIYLPVLLPLILFTSCVTYNYTTIDAKQLTKNERSAYVYENDTLRVEYNFSNSNNHIGIKIFNKLKNPISINWKESSIIVNGKAHSYYNPSNKIQGVLNRDDIASSNTDPVQRVSFNGMVSSNDAITFIPPQSFIDREQFDFHLFLDSSINKMKLKKEKIRINNFKYKIHKVNYTSENTPLTLSSYISFTISNVQQTPVAMQHDFYISSYTKTRVPSETLYQGKPIPENTYTRTGSTNFSRIIIVLTSILLVTAAITKEQK